jgi:GST-like protein
VTKPRFIGGEQPGALDLYAAVVSRFSGARRHLRASRPAFAELLERIESHPAVSPVLGRHWRTVAALPVRA